jgi:formylglycine-generating enzyme required for sulfatase activity
VGTATLGAGLWGQLDLAGSVFEWNLDSDNGFFHSYPDPCTDCAVLTPSTYQVYRGGYWLDPSVPGYMLTSNRIFNTSTFRSGFLGFRCARAP